MSLVEVNEPLVFLNEELISFVLKSPDFSNRPDFHIILTDLSEPKLLALKGFFLLLEKQTQTIAARATSVCLTIDFSAVAQGKCAGVYQSLLENIGPQVTELRLSGMENPHLNVDPFSVANPVLLPTFSFPNLHTIRISNLGGRENILWLSYFLNGAKNLKQLHLGPFEDVYIQGLGKWEEEAYSLLPSSAKIGSKNDIRLEQLKTLGQCTNFEGMTEATLFIKGLSISKFSSRTNDPSVRKSWDGKSESEIGVGIPIPMKIQIQVSDDDHRQRDDIMVKAFCTTPSLIVLSGLGFYSSEPYLPRSLPSPFQQLAKLELESTIVWLMGNLKNFPSLKHLIWRPLWSEASQKRQNSVDFPDAYAEFLDFEGCSEVVLEICDEICISFPNVELLRLKKSESVRPNLEIFRIVQDWTTAKILPFGTVYLHIKKLSSNFPRLKTFACEVHESAQVEDYMQIFPQVKEFYFNKYVPITEIKTERAPQKKAKPRTGRQEGQSEVSYKLENFRQKMTSFKTEVENQQKVFSKDVERQVPKVKLGAFIFDESMNLFRTGQPRQNIEVNVPEICWAISNLNLSAIVIPVQSNNEAVSILEAIKSAEPKDLEHVHFQIPKNVDDPNSYDGIPRNIIASYEPYFLVTNDFEPGKNSLSCSVLVKDFWE